MGEIFTILIDVLSQLLSHLIANLFPGLLSLALAITFSLLSCKRFAINEFTLSYPAL